MSTRRFAGYFLLSVILSLIVTACGSESSDGDETANQPDATDDASGPTSDLTADTAAEASGPDWRATCAYPENSGFIELGKIMPRVEWRDALLADGTHTDLDLRAFHCAPEYDDYSTAIFSVTAGWCPACPSQVEYIADIADEIEAAGGLLVFVETQTADALPATHEDSQRYIERIIGPDGPGIRVGDGESLPEAMAIDAAAVVTSYPAGFVVRRSDMVVIASQSQSDTFLPYAEIARDPDSVWETTNPNDVPNCGPADEEPYEPNDTASEAAVLTAPLSFRGGICDALPDFYRIDSEVRWTIQIEFEHTVGDLDMFVWDEVNNEILTDAAGHPIGSATVNDQEVFQGQGPLVIVIFGYAGATSTYELWLAEIG